MAAIDTTSESTHKFTYINTLVNEFYKFMGDIYIEHKLLVLKEQAAATATKTTTETTEPTKPTESNNSNKSFSEYFLFKLYYNYGIKRRMVNDHIALLYYAKNLKGYKTSNAITMLCRHMMLDLNIMRIISLGIPKAVKIDDFCKSYDIDKANVDTSFDSLQNLKYRVYKFSEGTMMTYNPTLQKYSSTITDTTDTASDSESVPVPLSVVSVLSAATLDDEEDNNDDTKKTNSTSNLSSEIQENFNKQFMYSTRKVVGTSSFCSLKTFFEMFEENNKIANTNLENIPAEIINDKVLVFNIEHPENRVISSQIRNFNTLCAVFEFKSDYTAGRQHYQIMKIDCSKLIEGEGDSELEILIREGFNELGKDMVSQIQVSSFKKQVQEYNVNLHLPEIIKSFEKLSDDGKIKTAISIQELSIERLESIVQNKPKDFQGYIIYGINGERTKITNAKYKVLRDLKGNKPIVIEQWNTKNLFYLYWRLVKENTIEQFLAEFDNPLGLNGPNTFIYTKLFNWFLSIVKNYAFSLFQRYHYTFVKRTVQKSDIPFSMKPMCGDLHKSYLENRTPISTTMVEKYIFDQPISKIFWRLFLDTNAAPNAANATPNTA